MTTAPVLEIPSDPGGPDAPLDPPIEAPGAPGVGSPVEAPGPEPLTPDSVPDGPAPEIDDPGTETPGPLLQRPDQTGVPGDGPPTAPGARVQKRSPARARPRAGMAEKGEAGTGR